MSPAHIFMDLDGTLFRSEEDIRGAWRATLAELKLDCPQFDRVFRVGPSLQAMTEELFPGMGMAARIVPIFKRHYDASQLERTLPYPGVDGWLRSLSAMGCRLYTLMNKRLKPTMMLVERYGWIGLFEKVLGSDSFELPVPAKTAMLKLALERLEIVPSDAYMVGDTPEDVAAGRNAGVHTVACGWGYASLDELQKARPDVIIELSGLTRLEEFIRKESLHERDGA